MYCNLCDAAKTVPIGKCIASNSYIRKDYRSQISNLSFHLKKSEKQE